MSVCVSETATPRTALDHTTQSLSAFTSVLHFVLGFVAARKSLLPKFP